MTQRHGIDIVPSQAETSPHGVDVAPGEQPQWWTPTWSECAKQLGWRWILFAPLAMLIILVCLSPLQPGFLRWLPALAKPVIIIILLPTGAFVKSLKTIVQNRKDPFCIHCGYSLVGLEDGHRCPECGKRFSLAVIEEYRRDPRWFIKRWEALHTHQTTPVLIFESGASSRRKSRDGT